MARSFRFKNQKELEKALIEAVDSQRIYEKFIEIHGDEVIRQVVAAAKLGIGPGDKPYPGYSESYQKQIAKKGGRKFFLRGIGKEGRSGGSLDEKNFSWEIRKDRLWLIWKAPNKEAGVYMEVHNSGKPIGKGGPRKKREFMHFEAGMTRAAVEKGFQEALEAIAVDFDAGKF